MEKIRSLFLILISILTLHFGGIVGCNNSSDGTNDNSNGASSFTLIPGRNAEEVLIPGSYNLQDQQALTMALALPPGEGPFPVLLVLHGSGGLFEEITPGQACSETLEANFQGLRNLALSEGFAFAAPSSFFSSDPRCCEDNDPDYLAFCPEKINDRAHRRLVTRLQHLAATMNYLSDHPQLDVNRVLLTGTSNGGSIIFAYLNWFFEENLESFFQDDAAELAPLNFVAIPHRILPVRADIISPGCGVHGFISFTTDAGAADEDLYSSEVPLDLEIGDQDEDSVPEHCTTQVAGWPGEREIQAQLVSGRTGRPLNFDVTVYPGGKHDLLGGSFGDEIRQKLSNLMQGI